MLNKQEIFDKCLGHMRKQGTPCVNGDNICLYRGEGGARCAIGALILDEFYDESLEGNTVDDSKVISALIKSGIVVEAFDDEYFLADLQSKLHDYFVLPHFNLTNFSFPEWLEQSADLLAGSYGLNYAHP